MVFVQRIRPVGDGRCETGFHDPDGCHVIDCVTTEAVADPGTGAVIHEAGSVVWHSHMTSEICPEHRLNAHHDAEDHRSGTPVRTVTTELCAACEAHPAAQGHFGL